MFNKRSAQRRKRAYNHLKNSAQARHRAEKHSNHTRGVKGGSWNEFGAFGPPTCGSEWDRGGQCEAIRTYFSTREMFAPSLPMRPSLAMRLTQSPTRVKAPPSHTCTVAYSAPVTKI